LEKFSDDKIDHLFQGYFNDIEHEPSQDSWKYLSKDLARQNFLSFGWKHFNIYQVVVGFVFLGSAALYFFSRDSNKKTENFTPNKTRSEQVLDSANSIEPQVNSTIKITRSKRDKFKPSENKLNATVSDSVPQVVQDSTPAVIAIPAAPPKPVRKVFTQIVRDTTIVKDTVTVKRKRKRKE
jgi:cytoskeletal protein RodZ